MKSVDLGLSLALCPVLVVLTEYGLSDAIVISWRSYDLSAVYLID